MQISFNAVLTWFLFNSVIKRANENLQELMNDGLSKTAFSENVKPAFFKVLQLKFSGFFFFFCVNKMY